MPHQDHDVLGLLGQAADGLERAADVVLQAIDQVPTFRTCPAILSAAKANATAMPRNDSAMTASDMAMVGPDPRRGRADLQ